MFTTSVPGLFYALLLAVAPHVQAPPPADPFLRFPEPPEMTVERSAAREPSTGGAHPDRGSVSLG